MQRKDVWTASKMHLLLIRDTALESEEKRLAKDEKGDEDARISASACVHV